MPTLTELLDGPAPCPGCGTPVEVVHHPEDGGREDGPGGTVLHLYADQTWALTCDTRGCPLDEWESDSRTPYPTLRTSAGPLVAKLEAVGWDTFTRIAEHLLGPRDPALGLFSAEPAAGHLAVQGDIHIRRTEQPACDFHVNNGTARYLLLDLVRALGPNGWGRESE